VTRVEGEDIILLMACSKEDKIFNLAWLVMVTSSGGDSKDVCKECAQAQKSCDIEGENGDKASSKFRIVPVKKDLDPKIEVLLEEVQFMPSTRLA